MIKMSRISVLWLAAVLCCVGPTLGVAGQDRPDETIFADFLASYDEPSTRRTSLIVAINARLLRLPHTGVDLLEHFGSE